MPTIFDEATHKDLSEYRTHQHPNLTLLQYIDELLVAAETKQECLEGTQDLLEALKNLDYHVSTKTALLCHLLVSSLDTKAAYSDSGHQPVAYLSKN